MSPLRILGVHNYYLRPGGEDTSFAQEMGLMERRGHEVVRFTRRNDELGGRSAIRMAADAVWNRESYRSLRGVVRKNRIDVVHFQNTFPVISPAAIHAAKAEGAATVMSLRNYRLLCANSLLMRRGRPCELCVGRKVGWQGIRHRCYKDSRAASAAVVALNTFHRAIGTWTKKVDMFIALTEFARSKLIEGGLPAPRIAVNGNFLSPDPGSGTGSGRFFLYVGRLSEEKGIATLLDAWAGLVTEDWKLVIVGSGPEDTRVTAAQALDPSIEWLGQRDSPEIMELMGEAVALVFPSRWYEGMPRTIIEAFSRGTPVLAFDLGAMREMIISGRTGFLGEPGDTEQLRLRLRRIIENPEEMTAMRVNCRAEYREKYTEDSSYDRLRAIYDRALGGGGHGKPAGGEPISGMHET
jgi:glycosyltransferase involved in cell wall biosynthesis